MATRLNRSAYEKMIEEDRAWLAKMPHTLERDHINLVLQVSAAHEHREAPAAPPRSCPGTRCESQAHYDMSGQPRAMTLHCPGCTSHAPHAPEAGRLTERERTFIAECLDYRYRTKRIERLAAIIDRLTKEQP